MIIKNIYFGDWGLGIGRLLRRSFHLGEGFLQDSDAGGVHRGVGDGDAVEPEDDAAEENGRLCGRNGQCRYHDHVPDIHSGRCLRQSRERDGRRGGDGQSGLEFHSRASADLRHVSGGVFHIAVRRHVRRDRGGLGADRRRYIAELQYIDWRDSGGRGRRRDVRRQLVDDIGHDDRGDAHAECGDEPEVLRESEDRRSRGVVHDGVVSSVRQFGERHAGSESHHGKGRRENHAVSGGSGFGFVRHERHGLAVVRGDIRRLHWLEHQELRLLRLLERRGRWGVEHV